MVSRLGLTRNQLAMVSKDPEVIKQLEKLFSVVNDLVDGGVPAGAAEALATTGADVDVGSAAPPTVGQVLTATSATAATWQASTAAPSGPAGGDLTGTYPNPDLVSVISRAAGDTSLGLEAIAGQAGYVYVVGDADPFTYVQMLAGTGGYVELGLFPGSGIDAVIKNQNIVGPAMDLDIQGQLGAAVVVNKTQRDVDFYVSSDTAQFLLLADAGTHRVGIGTDAVNEILTVEGRLSLRETTAPTATADYGKIYVKATDGQPYFMDDAGVETAMLGGGSGLSQAQVLARGLGA